ncbi:MAG: aminotransferase class IV [Aureispira sp.]
MENRSFLYGDGLFETIRVSEGQALYLRAHFERLTTGLNTLQMQAIKEPLTYQQFKEIIEGFIAQQATANLRIRSTFFRQGGGRYTPQKQAFDYHLEATPLATPAYPAAPSSLIIGLAQQARLSTDALSPLKTTSALPYVLAGLEKKQQGWDDCLLLNHQGYIAEAIAANVFLKIGERIVTPALDQGCIAGVMRQQLLQLLPQLGYEVEERAIALEELQEADEMWLSNALQGVVGVTHWIGREQPYKKVNAEYLQQHLSSWAKKCAVE